MNFNRIGRILVCLLVVCALVINISPIKAKAIVVELTLAEWGLIAMAALLTAGISINIAEQFELEAVGNLFKTTMQNTARDLELDEEVVEQTFRVVIADDTSKKQLPFSSDPDGFGWALFGLLHFFEVFTNSHDEIIDELIAVNSPSFGTVAEGEIVSHGQYEYEVISSSAPVHYYIWCSPRTSTNRHGTVFYSANKFSVDSNSSVSIDTMETTRNGVNAFFATEYLGWDGYCAQCSFHLEAQTLEESRIYVCSLLAAGEPVSDLSATIVDDTVQTALQGASVIDSINVPDIDYTSISSLGSLTGVIESLNNGELSFEDLLQELTGGETITVNPGSGIDPDPDPGTGSDPDTGGDSAESTWWQRLYQWLLEIKTSINELPNKFDEHFENMNNNIQEVPNKFETWFQNILSAIASVPQAIVSGIKNVLTELFVPDPEFIPNKVEALKAEYKFLDPMLGTGEDLKLFFQNIGSQPPIIWIDLGAGTGWHPMGGKVKFIDLTWYAQYKPTVDPIVGGFIWLWVAWRMFMAVPGLLAGDSGTVGAPIIVPDLSFNQARLPAGRSRRKKDGE